MSRTLRIAVLAVAVVVLAVAPGGAAPTATITAMSANLTTTAVAVAGKAAFASDAIVVGTDGTGDAIQKGVGADVTEASIQLASNGRDLVFTLKIADQLPAPALMGPSVVYNWGVSVNGTDNGFFLHSGRAGLSGISPATDPVFDLLQNTPDGFLHVASVTGKMADGVVQWTLPMSQIGAAPGATISTSEILPGSHAGVTGTYVYYNNAGGDGIAVDDFTVPGSVSLGIGPSTTPADQILTTTAAVMKSNGSFTGSLPLPAEAGTYTVVAKAFADEVTCTLSSSTVTKP